MNGEDRSQETVCGVMVDRMASVTTNKRVDALREQQLRERLAAGAAVTAARAVETAVQRRATALTDLDARVTEARHDHRLALAVLAAVLHDDVLAASVAGVEVMEVRSAGRQVDSGEVRRRIAALGERKSKRAKDSGDKRAEGSPPEAHGSAMSAGVDLGVGGSVAV
jgi:hypothetical protein